MNLKLSQQEIMEMSGGIWPYKEVQQRLEAVKAHGLKVQGIHLMGDTSTPEKMLEMLPYVKELGKNNEIAYCVISLMKGLEAIKPFATALEQMACQLAELGIALAYHNHEVECMPEAGTTALDYLLEQCPHLKLQLDVGWAKFAGTSAVELMKKYQDRLIVIHFKDIRADASPENRATCFTAVGQGSIPLKDILAEGKNCPLVEQGYVIDQDDSLGDILDDLAVGVKNIQASL